MTNAIVYYHKNCIDGVISALSSAKYLGFNNVTYKPLTYGDVSLNNLSEIEECFDKDLVFVLDFSFKKEVLESISSLLRGKMVIIDHHESVFKDLGLEFTEQYLQVFDNIDVYLSPNKKSGAILTYDFFNTISSENNYEYDLNSLYNGNKVIKYPYACVLADDGDRWIFKEGNVTNYFRAGMYSFMSEWSVDKNWLSILDDQNGLLDVVLDKGSVLDKNHKNMVEIIAKDATNIMFYDWNVNIVNANPIFSSDLGNLLAKTKINNDKLPDFAIVWYYNHKKNEVIASLRSIGEFNVSDVASEFNGGGHKNAAGFAMPAEEFMILASML